MPLIVQPDGTVAEGAIPPGGATVLVLDNGQVKEAFFSAEAPPAPTGDVVTRERLQYDRPEVVPGQTDRNVLAVRPTELVPPQREDVIAALLVRAEETNPSQTETIRITATITSREAVPPQADRNALAARANEVVPKQMESHDLALRAFEVSPVPVPEDALAAKVYDIVPPQTDSQMLASMVYESVPTPEDDIQALLFITPEQVPAQTELIRTTATVRALETVPTITEGLAAAVIEQDNVLPPPLVTENLTATLTGYASAVVSNTGWVNPNNSLGNTTGTATTLTATASGLAGTTNNTTNGTIVLDFNDVNLGDLTISNVDLFVETQRANAGVAIAQPTSNVQWQYSLDGTTFTTFHTITAVQAKGVQTIDITALVGQDQSKLSALRIRATGSVTSGTGLGAGNTVSFFRAWMVVNAARAY